MLTEDVRWTPSSWAFDERLLAGLPDGVGPRGEGAGFTRSFGTGRGSPHRSSIELGEVVKCDRFVFGDVLPV